MATFVLIHGAGDVAWSWHLVAAELRAKGHDVVAPDLPCEDDGAGLDEYANTSSAGSVIAFHKFHDDLAPGNLGVLCAFGAGYSAGVAVLRKV